MRTSPFPYNKGNTRVFFITFCMMVCLCYLYSVFHLTEATKFTVDPKNVVQERNKNQKKNTVNVERNQFIHSEKRCTSATNTHCTTYVVY